MSLRARLLVGMSVVGVVLVVAAVVITRATESYLVERVDAQLAAAQSSVQGGFDDRGGPHGGPGNTYYFGRVVDGQVQIDAAPSFAAADAPTPAVDVDQLVASARTGQPFTVGTDPPSDSRYRVLGIRSPRGAAFAALPLADVDASVSRLKWVELII